MKNFDTVIVGAGPAGNATAISLAQKGYAVALIDKQNFPREKLCGDFVNPINWPRFRELGAEERILAEAHCRITGFRITSPSGKFAQTLFSQSDQIPSYGLGLRRAALDTVLLQRANEAGSVVRTDCRLQRVSRSSSGWQLATSTGENWIAKTLVGADGRNSWVARQLGINKHTAVQGRSVGFQLRLECADAGNDRIEIHLFPGGYAGLVNVGDGISTLGLAIDKNLLPSAEVKPFLLRELTKNPFLKRILQRAVSMDGVRSAYPVYFSKRRSFADAVLLVGDAARVTEPVSGEGIYFAMTSGIFAAKTLDDALRKGDLSENFLSTYERACQRAFRSRLLINSMLRFAIYRPALVDRLIHWSAMNNRFLTCVVDKICVPATAL
jgi:geranylgeranyl reductase family protein